jgi:predicted nucleic acid-binding protein
MIVVDTNLLVHLYVPGELTTQAEEVLRREPVWVSVPLWRSEFRNALCGFIHSRALTLAACKRIAQQAELWMLGREHSVTSDRVLELAAESGSTAYDCEFVALAEAASLQLVTSDQQILRAFPQNAVSPRDFLA